LAKNENSGKRVYFLLISLSIWFLPILSTMGLPWGQSEGLDVRNNSSTR
jgi:hypothetical protein